MDRTHRAALKGCQLFCFWFDSGMFGRQTTIFPTISKLTSFHSLQKKASKNLKPTSNLPEKPTESKRIEMSKNKQFWLLKTEPGEWSWDDQASNGGTSNWDGVKNKQAQKNLKAMKIDDLCFFYHSGAHARRVVGVVTVVKEWYEVNGEGAVDVKAVGEMRRPVDLKEMKGDERLKGFALFRQPRLSVVPVSEEVWEGVCDMCGGFEGDGKDTGLGDDDAEN